LLVDRAFDAAGLKRRSAFEADHVPTIMRLIEEGIGVSLLPDMPTEYSPGVRRVDVHPQVGTWEAAVSFVGDEPKNPAARAFYELLLKTPRRRTTLVSQ
jgi:DNA-binding transcriptional LysR family regulator